MTGASGTLGGLLARHLVVERGVRRLLLVSRRGDQAPGAVELGSGALPSWVPSVRWAACDVADRDAAGRGPRRRSPPSIRSRRSSTRPVCWMTV
ncbi:KR domain-containing protein [Streptomyces sp. Mo3]|uniref:KR domain-containing protein n=1 Tax=Streptomyces sp. Mo3 TaxID=3161190 RepID=UPI0039EEE406